MTGSEDERRISVWVADGDGPPSRRLEITACPGCAALVTADRVDVHLAWHRRERGPSR